MVWTSLSSYGGFFGAVIGGFYWRWKRELPLFPVLDQIAFGLPLGWFFGRLGCFVVHDHPGKVTDFFLAVDELPVPRRATAPRHDLGTVRGALVDAWWCRCSCGSTASRGPTASGSADLACCTHPCASGSTSCAWPTRTYDGLTPGHYSSILTIGARHLLFLAGLQAARHVATTCAARPDP